MRQASSYVALAETLGTTLATADSKLASAPGLDCEIDLMARTLREPRASPQDDHRAGGSVLKPRAALEDIGHRPRRRSGGASLLGPMWATSTPSTSACHGELGAQRNACLTSTPPSLPARHATPVTLERVDFSPKDG